MAAGLTSKRRLDQGAPSLQSLKLDFRVLQMSFTSALQTEAGDVSPLLRALDQLVRYRNAIAHDDPAALDDLPPPSVETWDTLLARIDVLAVIMDSAVAEHVRLLTAEEDR